MGDITIEKELVIQQIQKFRKYFSKYFDIGVDKWNM